ncbi:response regulator transcription factor [Polaribacter sp. MSW13]|uniref:Response regulator transcription factor n=1 Tax=Polaribacter marinus TaxID=2916838 RepID=A0A9X1VQY8_9FLAO|nr:response regulator transcription factor [Polaribacter marinus]MCI2227836.1 response regulator transcription factor [Polaribacter marinus]
MKHKLLIIEDDPFISLNIQYALEAKGFHVIGIAETVTAAEELFYLEKPDLCLIDIQLGDSVSGVEFAKVLDQQQLPYFYLTSQTDPLTLLEVSKTKPLGYIVKPFTDTGLWSSISVVWQQYLSKNGNKLTIKTDGYVHIIPENDILFLEAFDNYCYIQTAEKKLLVPHTLKKTREQLKGNHFFMVHRSYWVNTQKIKSISNHTVVIHEFEVALSRARKEALISFMNEI